MLKLYISIKNLFFRQHYTLTKFDNKDTENNIWSNKNENKKIIESRIVILELLLAIFFVERKLCFVEEIEINPLIYYISNL